MELVRWFADLGKDAIGPAGGKGANLGEMTRAGLPVPPGFVLLTSAYRAFVAANQLQGEIVRLAGPVQPDDAASADEASAAIRALFDQGAIPPEVAAAVLEAYGALGGGTVAVRSSATAEDLPGASFAGQQETYLNISGNEAVLAAVKRCWSSLWTPRAISYRARQSIGPDEVALAVVIQRQINAEAAGVLFTANPVTGHRRQMVIDGAWGLGESVVSGLVTPDHWVADGTTGAIIEAQVQRKLTMTVRTATGTEQQPVPEDLQLKPCLDAAGVGALVALGRKVAAHYGSPQDLEWALADGRFYLVQSRPITTLFPLPAPEPPADAGLRVYLCGNMLQGILEPLTPMGLYCFQMIGYGAGKLVGQAMPPGETAPAVKQAHMRMYIDATTGLRHPRVRKVIMTVPQIIDRPMGLALKALAERERRIDPVPGPMPVRLRFSLAAVIVPRMIMTVLSPRIGRRMALRDMDRFIREREEAAARATTFAQKIAFVRQIPNLLPRIARLGPVMLPAVGLRFVVEDKLQEWLGDAAGFQPVVRALPHNPTTQMDLELWRVSRRLMAEGAHPTADHPAVQAFLAKYGHRGVREIDIGMPRWSDDPAHVLNVLVGYLAQGDEADAEAHFRRGAEAAEAAIPPLVAAVRQRKGWLKAAFMRFLLRRVRELAGMREYPKFYAVKTIAINRQVLQSAGADLVAQGRLDQPEDIFFLTLPEAESGGDLRAMVSERRAEYTRELGRRAVPRILTSEGEAIYGAPPAAEGALVGTPASAGVYEGRVRVIHDPKGARLEPGEVLVAPGTDPAWTPLFLTAGALVMEIGGVMSHGSVVAREYGIPAVVGVAGATERLKTGDRVRVDGETGQVLPLA